MLRLVIDTDTASDDAVALLLAAKAPEATIEAVTTVAGNVPLAQGTANAIATLDLVGCTDVPVHAGLDRPLLRTLGTAQDVHGKDGMGDIGFPPPTRTAAEEHAVDLLLRLATDAPGELTLVTLGPLTNVAAALVRDRRLLTRFRHTYLMAGAPDGVGNVSPVAEYNAWADPEAIAMVLASEGERTLVGWNVSRTCAVMRPADQDRLRVLDTELARFVLDINVAVDRYSREVSGLEGFDLPDPVTMAVALDPTIVTSAEVLPLTAATSGIARGMTYADRRAGATGPPTSVVWAVDEAAFKDCLAAACG